MPHLFVPRRRSMDLGLDPAARRAFAWESFNAFAYKTGGLMFVIGSVLFFPRYEAHADLGAWIYFAGSWLYLIVTAHDLAEVLRTPQDPAAPPAARRARRREVVAASAYVAGTLLFLVGSVLFLSWVDRIEPGAWCFIFGSVLFVAGAVVNLMQSYEASGPTQLQLLNLTAVTFVTGSALLVVASAPYLWGVTESEGRSTLHAFLAAQYLVGSLLFLLGGVFNDRRIWLQLAAVAGGRGRKDSLPAD